MDIWRRNGSHLIFTLPRNLAEPVLPYLDRYMVVTRDDTGDVVELIRRSVNRQLETLEVWYLLPTELFDCGARSMTANCLLVEEGEWRFRLEPTAKDGTVLVANNSDQVQVIGAIDYFDGERIRGWAINKNAPMEKITLGIFLDNEATNMFSPSEMRRDIMRRHGGNGQCGFNLQLPNKLFDGTTRVLCCAPTASLHPLRNGLIKVDLPAIEDKLLTLLHERFARLERLLE